MINLSLLLSKILSKEVGEKLTREQAIDEVRKHLARALSLDVDNVHARWQDDELRVTLPTRCEYMFDLTAIGKFVDQVAERVDLRDSMKLTEDEYIARLERFRRETE